ncbi:competence protein CoiA [Lacticaseibacillus suibinensis]|uniref:competence protein CoiA n=1 Tax=Lacticaseibacillus suibinensis TaxID=2486011 RepID=UPI000F7AA83D|nr:competence protein CoiA family protein [Lacticaseibacillus suibinensis]
MFVAQAENGRLVTLRDHQQAKALHERFVCPACLRPVGIRNGALMPAHFYHLGPPCAASEPESLPHLLGKQWLSALGEQFGYRSELEVYYPAIKQRADVVWLREGKRTVLEYQCSPLSVEALAQRTAGYAKLDLVVIWIAGPRYFDRWPAAKQAKFLRYTAGGFQLLFLDPQAGVLSQWTLHADHIDQRLQWPNRVQQRRLDYAERLVAEAKAVQAGLRFREPKVMALQGQAARFGLNVAGVPWVVHQQQRHLPGLVLPEWQLRTWWLLQFQTAPIQKAAEAAFWRQFSQVRTPLIPDQAVLEAVRRQWLAVLKQAGYLQETPLFWQWQQQPNWYATVTEKLQQLR